MEFNLDTTIKELHELGIISVRTYNSLHYAGMDTLGEILENIETPMDFGYCHTWHSQENSEDTTKGNCQSRRNKKRVL